MGLRLVSFRVLCFSFFRSFLLMMYFLARRLSEYLKYLSAFAVEDLRSVLMF